MKNLGDLIAGAEAVVVIREASDGRRQFYTMSACPCRRCVAALAQDLLDLGAKLEARLLAAEAVAEEAGEPEVRAVVH